MLAVVIAEAVAILLLGLLVAGLLRSHAEILRALHDLGASIDPDDPAPARNRSRLQLDRTSGATGELAKDIAGIDPRGETVAAAVAEADHDTLLAFLSTGCDTCRPFWSAINNGLDLPGVRILVVVADEESESELVRIAEPHVEVIASTAAWTDYEVPGSPHFVYVEGATGRIVGEGTGPDWPAVRALLTQANADRSSRTTTTTVPMEWRDNPTRIDAELLAAGIGPGHSSLVSPPETQ